jgi:serine/threonine-protein kinase ATR
VRSGVLLFFSSKLLRITPLRVIIPLQRFLIGTLPPPTSSDFKEHHPFPLSPPRIFSFKDSVEVLNSLQRPKKITVIGDDGMEYVFLCKPKDDLRKDQRIMEFFSTVNTILNKYSESRLRCLRIRTYAVVVLNEECGMLEWVHHTERLRQILNNIYESRDATFTSRVRKEIKTYFSLKSEQRLSVTTMLPFLTNLIKLHYPALFEWFLLKFPDPSTWYASRVAYTNSVSLMSMVGYVVGLGDRHGENLLVDSTTGECVHVDFNCLFEKGKTLPLPERVPFRLTHNMIDALGITGYEGLFRKTCQLTLKVLRNEKSSLVNMLAPFVYDPVGDCDSSKIIKTVENKLQGKLADNGLPLSTEGQVHRLIQEATDLRNLCIMYIGWAAYI